VLDDLIRRGLRRPEFLIVDGAPGLEAAIAAVWDGVPVQRCTTTEWKSRALRAYQRRTLAADALIASCYLAGTNTRRVRRALGALFRSARTRAGPRWPRERYA
jgi:transposase-like protein